MKTCYYYFPIEPLLEHYKDDGTEEPIVDIPVQKDDKIYNVSLFAINQLPYLIRISIPKIENETLSDDDMQVVQMLKEHMVSLLKTNYNPEIEQSIASFQKFIDENKPPR